MPDNRRRNTKLTSVEVRWIKNSYRKMVNKNPYKAIGSKKLADKINEGRKKVGMEIVSKYTVQRIISKLNNGDAIVPIDASAKKTKCPKCGHVWYR